MLVIGRSSNPCSSTTRFLTSSDESGVGAPGPGSPLSSYSFWDSTSVIFHFVGYPIAMELEERRSVRNPDQIARREGTRLESFLGCDCRGWSWLLLEFK